MFDLPVAFVPRKISTIKVNKRQMYRRRHVLLAEIADQISFNLTGPHPVRHTSGVEIEGRGMETPKSGHYENVGGALI
jgi:hypothetical protein